MDRVRGDGAARVAERQSGSLVHQSDQILLRNKQLFGGVFRRPLLQSSVSVLSQYQCVLIDSRVVSETRCVVPRATFWLQSRALQCTMTLLMADAITLVVFEYVPH